MRKRPRTSAAAEASLGRGVLPTGSSRAQAHRVAQIRKCNRSYACHDGVPESDWLEVAFLESGECDENLSSR